tara:strand:- start:2206 stop:3378 length:1173 start_codon:yes stop_codon:yes gene_type:complete
MAINRLTDIVTVFESKWTYGDVKFGYEGEVNQEHDTQYPLMLIQPPESTIPEIYNGREEYTFEINFYNLYSQAAQDVVTLQKRWDNLQDMANEWLDFVLKNYQDTTVEAYLNDESIEIQRVKDVANDKLVQIKLTFTMSAFTKCFRPTSNYPSDFSDLVVWLRADSGVTFDIPTKRVSAWADKSGSDNNTAQATALKQPLRYGYDGQNDKAYFKFDGTNDYLTSDNNCPLTGNDLTIFYVGKANEVTADVQRVVGYRDSAGGGSDRLNFGIDNNDGRVYFKALDDSNNGGQVTSAFLDRGLVNHIACARIKDTEFSVQYNNNTKVVNNVASYSNSDGFALAPFTIGYIELGAAGSYWNGDIQEVIIYNRALSDAEIADVRGYLNLKYKIY